MPKVSVIIPCYNQGKYIEETLNSVFAQTLKDIEIICVNDASTDNTDEILKRYEAQGRIKYIRHEQNKGLAATRNTGIQAACSELIYPLDSDDLISSDCLEKLYSTLKNKGYRIVGCEVKTFDGDEDLFHQPRLTKLEMYGKHECCVASALYYKSDWEKFGGYYEEFKKYPGEDMDFWLNYIDNDLPRYRIPEVLFFYRIKPRSESYWTNFQKKEMKERRKIKNRMLMERHPKMVFYMYVYKFIKMIGKILSFFYKKKYKKGILKIYVFKICVLSGQRQPQKENGLSKSAKYLCL